MTNMTLTYVECDCLSDEHTLRFAYDPDDGSVYFSAYLGHWQPWYVRAWHGLKHVFGYTSKYGHFDNTVMTGTQLAQLRDMCTLAIDRQKQMNSEVVQNADAPSGSREWAAAMDLGDC